MNQNEVDLVSLALAYNARNPYPCAVRADVDPKDETVGVPVVRLLGSFNLGVRRYWTAEIHWQTNVEALEAGRDRMLEVMVRCRTVGASAN